MRIVQRAPAAVVRHSDFAQGLPALVEREELRERALAAVLARQVEPLEQRAALWAPVRQSTGLGRWPERLARPLLDRLSLLSLEFWRQVVILAVLAVVHL